MSNFRIEKLARNHKVDEFDCGSDPLNRFLTRFAWQNQASDAAITYVALTGDEVIGFYSLAVGQVDYADAAGRLAKGLAKHPVPIMLLARLAIASTWQGHGLGKGMLKDAMRRTMQAADHAGIRALVVHAKDDAAKRFYEHFDFAPSPTDGRHLFILLKDLRAASRQPG